MLLKLDQDVVKIHTFVLGLVTDILLGILHIGSNFYLPHLIRGPKFVMFKCVTSHIFHRKPQFTYFFGIFLLRLIKIVRFKNKALNQKRKRSATFQGF